MLWVIFYPECIDGDYSDKEDSKLVLDGIRKFFRWFCLTASHMGYDSLIKYLKNIADWGEFYFLISSSKDKPKIIPGNLLFRDGYLDFSKVFRGSLRKIFCHTKGPHSTQPKVKMSWILEAWYHVHLFKRGVGDPSPKMCSESFEKHRRILSTPSPLISDSVLNGAKLFSESYIKERSDLDSMTHLDAVHISSGAGSCRDSNRKAGGRLEFNKSKVLSAVRRSDIAYLHLDRIGPLYNIFGEMVISEEMVSMMTESSMFQYSENFRYMGVVNSDADRQQRFLRDECFIYLEEKGLSLNPQYTKCVYRTDSVIRNLYSEVPDFSFSSDYDPDIFKVEALAVPCRACKARIITKGDGVVCNLGHIFRTYLYSFLKRDPSNKLSEPLYSFVSNCKKKPGEYLVSLDLSSATDTFNRLLCKSLGQGIINSVPDNIHSLPVRRMMSVTSEFLCPEYTIVYPKDENLDSLKIERGMLMGTAESWGLLNLYLDFFKTLAIEIQSKKLDWRSIKDLSDPIFENLDYSYKKSKVFVKNWSGKKSEVPGQIFCGDDFLGKLDMKTAQCFFHLLELSGAVKSQGTNAISKHSGVFTEIPLAYDKSGKLYYVNMIRLVGIVDTSGNSRNKLPGSHESREHSSIFYRGIAFDRATQWWGPTGEDNKIQSCIDFYKKSKNSVLRWAHFILHDHLTMLIRNGVPLYLPMRYGGYELPHPKGEWWRHTSKSWKCLVLWLLRPGQTLLSFLQKNEFNVWLNSSPSLSSLTTEKLVRNRLKDLILPDRKLNLSNIELDEKDSKGNLKCWTTLQAVLAFNDISLSVSHWERGEYPDLLKKNLKKIIQKLGLITLKEVYKTCYLYIMQENNLIKTSIPILPKRNKTKKARSRLSTYDRMYNLRKVFQKYIKEARSFVKKRTEETGSDYLRNAPNLNIREFLDENSILVKSSVAELIYPRDHGPFVGRGEL